MTDADGVSRWYTADPRGVLPLDTFHCPKELARVVRQGKFEIRIDSDFVGTMRGCAEAKRRDEHGGWIGEELIKAYAQLHLMGFAHSVEAWQGEALVGGLYGVALGGAFFGESMFRQVDNASKVCLVHLVRRLQERNYLLLDTQMVTSHMKQFGCRYVPAKDYETMLSTALAVSRTFV